MQDYKAKLGTGGTVFHFQALDPVPTNSYLRLYRNGGLLGIYHVTAAEAQVGHPESITLVLAKIALAPTHENAIIGGAVL